MKNKKHLKMLSLVLAVILITSSVGVAAYAAGADSASDTKEKITAAASDIIDVDRKIGKDETVYVIAGADGTAKKIIVSDWLKNPNRDASITDSTDLENVKNVKGDESYTMNPDNMKVWDAQGNDIYYQGTSEKVLPVDLSIKYMLDGKAISAEELAGKSGKVTMHFDYMNNQFENVTIDGKEVKIYVPFVMITGMILDNNVFTNIEVSNGKLINDGNRSVVMGFAVPGLQENLAIDRDMFEIPTYVEITADVKDFALTTTLTLATNDVFNSINLGENDAASTVTGLLGELQSVTAKLVNGSSELYGGLTTLLDKSGELVAGIDKLYAASEELKTGADKIDAGSAELNTQLTALKDGLKTLTDKNTQLVGGAKAVFDTMLTTANTQIAASGLTVPALTIETYSATLNQVIASLSDENVKAEAQKKVLNGVLAYAGMNMTAEQYTDAVKAGLITAEKQALINEAVASEASKPENIQKLNEALTAAAAGRTELSGLLTQLDSYNEFYQGIIAYTTGVGSAYNGSGMLNSGSGELAKGAANLSAGAGKLSAGIGQLKDSSGALISGVTDLKNGAMQLSDGMKQIDDKGIKKIVELANGSLKDVATRMKATVDVSKKYQSYGGKAEDVEGTVKFIYRTESIGK